MLIRGKKNPCFIFFDCLILPCNSHTSEKKIFTAMVAGLEKNVLCVLLNNKELWLDRMPELIHAEMPTTLLRQRFLLVVNYSVGG